ncbi:MAG: carboxypeptidase-like regulatory domain-containing protein [Candidatus Cloacimonetes bacterium]|nr:carboxypeptidase-like regulatory domain-containing protein [Candidatus Cloacimonadota bacterium]
MLNSGKFILVFFAFFSLLIIGCEENPTGQEQPATVEGLVTNANTGGAIVGAVINEGINEVAISGSGGSYSFEIEAGTYNFTCTAEGYNLQLSENVEVSAGETTTLNFQLQPITIIPIVDDIVGNTTWTSNNLYLVDGEILISGILTIEPGTIIKYKSGANWIVQGASGGLINAEGTALLPIIFTSWHDDANGGDTNGNGNATDPARGDWDDIDIEGDNNSSTFDHCEFYYGGGYNDRHIIFLDPYTSVSITNCIFAHNHGEKGALSAYQAGSGTVIQHNIFFDNTWPLNINPLYSLDSTNIFHDPDDNSVLNDYNGILVEGNDIDGSITWSETEVPYVLLQNEYLIPTGNSLTFEAGVKLKLGENANFWINGTMRGEGTISEPVIFTSYKDDSISGDTNHDEDMTSPNPGDWQYIKILGANNQSSFDYCEFYYGGGYASDYTLYLGDGTAVNISSCLFVYNNGADDTVLNAGHASANTTIMGNSFYNNIKPLMISGKINLDASNTFHNLNNPSQTNTKNGIFIYSGSHVEGNVTWAEPEIPFVISTELQIDTSNSLTLADNVTLKFNGGSIWYRGDNLLNYDNSGVWFTSFKDDAHGGDTNGDGGNTQPATGDWNGIFNAGADPTYWETWENILYAVIH